jgi:hypothetical protein
MDRILIAKPVRTLDGIIHMPSPIVFGHVLGQMRRWYQKRKWIAHPQGCINTTLRSNSVAPRREELRYASSIEASFSQTEGSPQSGSTSSPVKFWSRN